MTDRQEIEARITDMMTGWTGEEIVEFGVGLVARGLFRTSEQQGKVVAADMASSVSSVFSATYLDMLRASRKD